MSESGPIKPTFVNISKIKSLFPLGAARRMLAQILQDFVKVTGAVLDIVDIIEAGTKKISSLKDYVAKVDKDNDVPKAVALGQVCRDSKVLTEKVLPLVAEYNAQKKSGAGTSSIRILLPSSLDQPETKKSTDVAVAQAPINLQMAGDKNRVVNQTGGATAVGEKASEPTFAYSEKWVVDKLMKDLGYQKIV